MHGESNSLLTLFAQTEIFIFVFMEIIVNIPPVHRVILKTGKGWDKFFFVLLFGGFSVMGTALGIPMSEGVVANIRDFAPMVAGLVGGPVVGGCVGLIGGICRLPMGGLTAVPCATATALTGLAWGGIHVLRKGKPLSILSAMLFALINEFCHGVLTFIIVHPWEPIMEAVFNAIPAMMVANSLGMCIAAMTADQERDQGNTKLWRKSKAYTYLDKLIRNI